MPIQISENIIYLGEIPNLNDFENRKIIGNYENKNELVDDYVKDDFAN